MTASDPAQLPPASSLASDDLYDREDIEFVIAAFGEQMTESDVCRLLCEERNYKWPSAQALVTHVQRQHRTAIARRQGPLLIVLGLFIALGGIAFIIAFGAETMTFLADPPTSRFERRQMYNAISLSVVGVFMLLGGGAGVLAAVRSFWQA